MSKALIKEELIKQEHEPFERHYNYAIHGRGGFA